jgi:hypothetical protein
VNSIANGSTSNVNSDDNHDGDDSGSRIVRLFTAGIAGGWTTIFILLRNGMIDLW